MRLKGKRVAVLAEEIYQEMELWVPYYRLKEEGAEVKIVALTPLGFPKGDRMTRPRKPLEEIIMHERWGGTGAQPDKARNV